jgi:hypothetical protein
LLTITIFSALANPVSLIPLWLLSLCIQYFPTTALSGSSEPTLALKSASNILTSLFGHLIIVVSRSSQNISLISSFFSCVGACAHVRLKLLNLLFTLRVQIVWKIRIKSITRCFNFFTNYKSTTKFMFTSVATAVYIAIPSFYYTLASPTNFL